ncbi:peroxiredoxin [Idiomarina xiamenensis]|uniref:Glutathione-dependent peroxiredoxin n=1 Tax=Idiomarina xiamenensis 10-D-4 TaxID=740709 RepID=K2JC42_9GAMM|nr:peroxiredoxin [Idiomarina xiamenensis]EKE80871.1 AhpC/TSA family peroxiredoxin [Idiomarina xiamenensis 10-D-4]
MIAENQPLPSGTVTEKGVLGVQSYNPAELFASGTHVLFAVPGAFTPTCSEQHLPGYVNLADKLAAAGVDSINCLAVNDAFVMRAWAEQLQVGDAVRMLSDGDASYSEKLGLAKDMGSFGGVRSQRYAMVIKDGVVSHLFVEGEKQFELSKAEHVLAALQG